MSTEEPYGISHWEALQQAPDDSADLLATLQQRVGLRSFHEAKIVGNQDVSFKLAERAMGNRKMITEVPGSGATGALGDIRRHRNRGTPRLQS